MTALNTGESFRIMCANVSTSLGVHTRPAPDMLFRADENRALFAKYDRYWLHSQPQFCKVLVDC